MGNLTPELFEAAGISLKPKPVEPAPTVKVETDLDHIAARINAGHEAFENMTRNALRVALDNGDELIAAQERVPKGEWQSWREEKCPRVKERMAQVYMQLARRREDIESELEKTPDLSLRAARQLITASPKRRRTSTPGEKKPQEDKPELPDWVVAYNESSDTDKAAGIAHIVTDLLTYMSAADRDKLMVRALGNAAEHAPTKKQRNAIREAQKPYLDGIPYTRIN